MLVLTRDLNVTAGKEGEVVWDVLKALVKLDG
jgi:hypothetical protein